MHDLVRDDRKKDQHEPEHVAPIGTRSSAFAKTHIVRAGIDQDFSCLWGYI